MNHPESILQRQCVKYFRLQYPKYLIYANANGGKRSKIEAAIMKGEGVLSGVPDLTIVTDTAVIWVELKVKGGRVSDNQADVMERLTRLGHPVYVCWSFDDFLKLINHLK